MTDTSPTADGPDDTLALELGRAARSLEPLHSVVYFAPEVDAELGALGLAPGAQRYVAQRLAAAGAVGSATASALLYTFAPAIPRAALPGAWSITSPADVLRARHDGMDAALRRLLGDAVGSDDMAEAADLACRAASVPLSVAGRPLYAGLADLAWPDAPHLRLWHALTLLREHRGDVHAVALQSAGLSGLEALITHTASGIGATEEFARTRRGWTGDECDSATRSLVERGLLDARGDLTSDGYEVRELVEGLTDDLAVEPWLALGESGVSRLTELALPWRDTLLDSGLFPVALFGPRWGDAR